MEEALYRTRNPGGEKVIFLLCFFNVVDSLYDVRHIDTLAVQKAESILMGMLEMEEVPKDEVLWRLSFMCYQRAKGLEDKKERIRLYEQGMEYAKKAMEINPKNPEAHFFYAVNMGKIGKEKGVLRSLFMVDDLKREADIVLSLDSLHVGARLLLASIYYELPGFVGGSVDRAIEYYKDAIRIDPNYTKAYIGLARCYVKKKMKDKAKEVLEKCLSIENPTHPADFYLEDRKDALEILEGL